MLRAPKRMKTLHYNYQSKTEDENTTDRIDNDEQEARWQWIVTADMLQSIPMYYKKHAQSSISLPGIAVEEISKRISSYMRIHSIACHYHPGNGHVDCVTLELGKFLLSLWRRPPSREELTFQQQGFIVEMELGNVQGDPFVVNRVRQGLFHAVRTGDMSADDDDDNIINNEGLDSIIREIQNHHDAELCEVTSPNAEKDASDSLVIALNLLLDSSDSKQNRIGMESLCTLSNPTIVERACADYVSQCLIFGEGQELGIRLRSAVLEYFVNTERTADLITIQGHHHHDAFCHDLGDNDDDDELQYIRGQDFGDMHNLALQVLENALGVAMFLKQQGPYASEIYKQHVDSKTYFWNTVLESLLYNLSVAPHRPNEAARSTRCLYIITLEFLPELLTDERLPSALQRAHTYGKSRHLKLEMETKTFLDRMGLAVGQQAQETLKS